MSFMDGRGVQLEPDELDASPLTADDAWAVAAAVAHDERMPEDQRVRLVRAVLDAAGPLLQGATA